MPEEISLEKFIESLTARLMRFQAAVICYKDIPETLPESEWEEQFIAWSELEGKQNV